MPSIGILLAIGSLLSFAVGDFFIQKSTRKIGNWETLFFIGFAALIFLFPFVKDDAVKLFSERPESAILIGITVLVVFFAALFNFEALKEGKIAVIEPILGIELPITIGLSIVLWNESITPAQGLLILAIFLGIILAITKHHTHLHYHKRIFEKGVVFAGIGAVGMGFSNFLTGVSSQNFSPLLAIWLIHSSIAIICLFYFLATGRIGTLFSGLHKYPLTIGIASFFDNAAWILFAFSASLVSISITTALTESYIAFAVLLGIFVNKEKLKRHQVAGIALATAGVIILSAISS